MDIGVGVEHEQSVRERPRYEPDLDGNITKMVKTEVGSFDSRAEPQYIPDWIS